MAGNEVVRSPPRERGELPVLGDRGARGRPAGVDDVDLRGLERALTRTVRGGVHFDAGNRAAYAHDSSNYRQVPLGVVLPHDPDDVLAALAACRERGAPVLPRGGGTSLAGQTCNVAVVIDTSKHMRGILEIDPDRRFARVEPGVVRDALTDLTEARHDLTFGPDTATHGWATLGGMIGNDSCGMHSVMAGRTAANVEELEVVTYDGVRMQVGPTSDDELERIVAGGGRRGEIYAGMRDLRDRYADLIRARYPDIPRRVSGYSLDALLPENGFDVARCLVGSEGTLATVLEARLRLVHMPRWRSLVVMGYPTMADGADNLSEILEHGAIALEAIDERLVRNLRLKGIQLEEIASLPEGGGWLLVEFGGESRAEAEEHARACMAGLERAAIVPDMKLYDDPAEAARIWKVREGALAATACVPGEPDHWEGWEDAAVPPGREGDYLRDFERLLERYDYDSAFYGHFGQGCIHTRINFDLRTYGGIEKWRGFLDEAADLVLSYGGSLSGEHGDGQSRAELLPKMFGPELVEAFRELKAIWDPEGRMNPHKVVDPYPIVSNLKLGAGHSPPEPATHFAYPDDGGSFARATQRCVGAGKCRELDGGTMCPSYVATRDEQHSTRGRARILFEMLEGEVITDGWQSEEVFDALDLCLACKGCTSECPVQVDMPTYKAEFLHHHYANASRRRPRHAYAFGYVDRTARLASRAPGLVNFLTQTPPLSGLAKAVAGIARERQIPTFAPLTLQAWFADRGRGANPDGRRVVLWPDTFSNHFHTDVGVACVEALEAAGWHVVIPAGHVCCGRPLYDYGFLDHARTYLQRTIDVLRDEIRAGTPVVGMEPSCLAVFRDELDHMLPHDEDARSLKGNAFHFDEFLDRFEVEVPQLTRDALVWGHCHHKATGGIAGEEKVLKRMGVEVTSVAGGCCGLAGSWGFEEGKHAISMACGEQALLPAVREADHETIVVADGFSCRTQIEQAGTGRRALHLAQLLKMAREYGPSGTRGGVPESGDLRARPRRSARRRAARAALAIAGAGTVLAALRAASSDAR